MDLPLALWGAGLLCLIPLGMGTLLGLCVLILKIGTIVQKAAEPPTEDGGEYSLDQGHEVK